jgi:hypothetical protein
VLRIPHVSPAVVDVLSTAQDMDGRWFAFASDRDHSDAPVQRWRLDTLELIDTLPATVRAVHDTTMIRSEPDGCLLTAPLPPLPPARAS